MERRKFSLYNNIISCVVLVISLFTYLSTIEPTASFWDCGEFIASSYKLEVGHPPGNPVFQLIARFFTMFTGADKAALMVNAMSAICSALTIFLLYLTIVHLGRRLVEKMGKSIDVKESITIFAAAVIGSLAYCFSDTFWFSAVEGEVYAMSSLFTALVFWAMLKWEEEAEERYANRWIALIAFLMGISIGIHLLNLLTIPALVFIYYYKFYEVNTKRTIYVLALSGVILAFILYGIIPYLPLAAAYVDLLFVNGFGLPMNIGAALFALSIIIFGFWGVYITYKRGKALLNTIILCVTLIIVGYSTFAVVIIRSCANTPTNEYQPDNAFTLCRYIGREQYGSNPLLYGETYASEVVDLKIGSYYNVLDGKYIKVNTPPEPVYDSNSKMLFPRMWSPGVDDSYVPFYEMFSSGRGKQVKGKAFKAPTFGDNLSYFWNYQVDFMYIRYFMWNFVGRQNDLHSTVPGDIYKGNWESGIKFIDELRLGKQEVGPDYIVNSRSKNHYFFLPLILGLLGLFYQFSRDKRNWVITMLLFVLTGIAVVIYLNQPPMQPRERDYAYAGSFYAFAIWIGLGVMWIEGIISKYLKGKYNGLIAGALALFIPIQMACENWDDHDRSNRYTARDLAYNYLMSVGENGILVTHGDNDTFPLWYIQEVEGVRTDVRIMNTSLLGTDWYIDQMQKRVNDSDPVKMSIPRSKYLYGVNDYVQVIDRFNGDTIDIKTVIEAFNNPKLTVQLSDGQYHNYIVAKNFRIPVNKENIIKYKIVPEKDLDKVPDSIVISLPQGKGALNKTELMILDALANYNWDRQFSFLQRGGEVNIGIKPFLYYDGFSYRLTPIAMPAGVTEADLRGDGLELYNRIKNVYRWESLADTTINIDYQNLLTFNNLISPREIIVNTCKILYEEGQNDKVEELLDMAQQIMPTRNFPLNNSVLSSLTERAVFDAIALYIKCGRVDKAKSLADSFIEEVEPAMELFLEGYNAGLTSEDEMHKMLLYLYMISDVFSKNGAPAEAELYSNLLKTYLGE